MMLSGNRIYKCENMQFTVKAQLNYLVILAAGLGYIQTEETLFTLEFHVAVHPCILSSRRLWPFCMFLSL